MIFQSTSIWTVHSTKTIDSVQVTLQDLSRLAFQLLKISVNSRCNVLFACWIYVGSQIIRFKKQKCNTMYYLMKFIPSFSCLLSQSLIGATSTFPNCRNVMQFSFIIIWKMHLLQQNKIEAYYRQWAIFFLYLSIVSRVLFFVYDSKWLSFPHVKLIKIFPYAIRIKV